MKIIGLRKIAFFFFPDAFLTREEINSYCIPKIKTIKRN